jgi:proteasome lid subunit RPN8/RPN11
MENPQDFRMNFDHQTSSELLQLFLDRNWPVSFHRPAMKAVSMYLFDKAHYSKFLRQACRSARKTAGTEICGLIVDTGCHLSFVPTHNVSSRVGGFALSRPDVRQIVAAAKVLGQEIVGTFHSHPVGVATPGKTDIQHAVDDSLMFIFDCTDRKGCLWKIKGGRARPLPFGFCQEA